MTNFDLSPLYRSSVGFDSLSTLLDSAFQTEKSSAGYPPYNIEAVEENQYAVTLAIAGFKEAEIDIQTENGVLTIRGNKATENSDNNFLHKGIAQRPFERKFNLADHVEVTGANLEDGLLTIELVKEIPEAMKPKIITINNVRTKDITEDREAA